MLDFLDAHGTEKWRVQFPTDYPFVKGCVFVDRNSSSGFGTIREAIRAKMAEKKKGAK